MPKRLKKSTRPARRQLELWTEPSGVAGPRVPVSAAAPAPHQAGPTWRGRRVHLIGIGGIGMSGIARLLRQEGARVTGCDVARSDITEALIHDGVPVFYGHSPSHLRDGADLVIISAAIRETNPEYREARNRGTAVVKYAQALGWLMCGREGVAVSGSHGKTTTTSMIAYTLACAGRNPSMVVGGIVPQMGGNARHGGTGPFVVEACEYDRSFLNLRPKAAVITNIDRDHLDCYGGMDELVEAFGCFAAGVAPEGVVVVNGDDPNAMKAAAAARARVETIGEGETSQWRVAEWVRSKGVTTFRVLESGREFGRFLLRPPGLHSIRNALACIAICSSLGVATEAIRSALASFAGAQRRFDRLGEADGVLVVDDYGHHPTEVRVTLDAARQEYPKRRMWCVFQPHQCSRTRLLMDEFARAFGAADHVIVPDIYSVRDTATDRRSVHARDLVREIRNHGVDAEYGCGFPETVERLLSGVQRGDLVMTMGAGPVNDVARSLLSELKKREAGGVLARSA